MDHPKRTICSGSNSKSLIANFITACIARSTALGFGIPVLSAKPFLKKIN